MARYNFDRMTTFLVEQRAAIIGLVEQAYAETGGHYARLPQAERRQQAERDGDAFIAHLRSGGVDWEAIRQRVRTAADPTLPADLLRMSGALARLFRAFVQAQLADQPALAGWLAARAADVATCVRVNLTAAQIDSMLVQLGATPDSTPAPDSYKRAA